MIEKHKELPDSWWDNNRQSEIPQVVIVTGNSGAGKNTMLHSLEDIGFYSITNLPVGLLQSFFESLMQHEIPSDQIALGLDVRSDVVKLLPHLYRLKTIWPFSLKIIFVTSSYQVLLKRFQETRRRHPLATSYKDLSDAIKEEQKLLQPLCDSADLVLDTDQFTIHQLRRFVIKAFTSAGKQQMVITVTAFGFKYSAPPESNLLFDVRFLPNPYFEPTLKELCGLDKPVYEYLFSQDIVLDYWQRLESFSRYVIEQSLKEGRFAMNIAFGCTGGRHRSVAFAHRFAQLQIPHVTLLTRFRDIERDLYRD